MAEVANPNEEASGQQRDAEPRQQSRGDGLTSAFQELPGPELYDPSWYNNKLRGEFGHLGSVCASGPLLPRSYHLRSEDLDNGELDDECENSLQFDKLPLFVVTELQRPGFENSQIATDVMDATTPVSDFSSVGTPGASSTNKVRTSERNSQAPKKGTQKLLRKQSLRKSLRLTGGVRFAADVDENEITTPVTGGGMNGSRKSRASRLFRKSRVFGLGEKDSTGTGTSGDIGIGGGRTEASRMQNILMKVKAGATKSQTNAGIFEFECSGKEAMVNLRTVIERQFITAVTAEKSYETRMQVAVTHENKPCYYNIVVVSERLDKGGCRLVMRRSFGDSLRGGAGEDIDWFWTHLYEELRDMCAVTRPLVQL